MEKTGAGIDRGFGSEADKYAAYLETPEGRLRLDLAFANLQDFLPQPVGSLLALDVGSGLGALGVRLAWLGLSVTLLDVSLPMLDFAKRAAREAGVTERIALNTVMPLSRQTYSRPAHSI
jgi:2-polyprenyl-3-methyl-5-hydroxy-6-metoxy-1,4-benzoquinol methylase